MDFFCSDYTHRSQRRDLKIDEPRLNIERGQNMDASKRVLREHGVVVSPRPPFEKRVLCVSYETDIGSGYRRI